MRCAVFHCKDGHHHHELQRLHTMKTVVAAMKTVVEAMKTVVISVKKQIFFEIFRSTARFFCHRRISGS